MPPEHEQKLRLRLICFALLLIAGLPLPNQADTTVRRLRREQKIYHSSFGAHGKNNFISGDLIDFVYPAPSQQRLSFVENSPHRQGVEWLHGFSWSGLIRAGEIGRSEEQVMRLKWREIQH
jgi:hypothetical protein